MTVTAIIWIGLIAKVSAILAPIPSPTGTASQGLGHHASGWSPKPTTPPSNAELRRRQSTQNVLYVAPGATCGFEDGEMNSAVSCGVGGTCAGYYNTYLAANVMGCCGSTCNFYTDCYSSAEVYTSSYCTGACLNNPEVLLCTETDRPFCDFYSVPNGNMGLYLCAGINYTDVGQLRSTWDGQPSSGIWTTMNAEQASASFGVEDGVRPLSLVLTTAASSSTSSSTTTSSAPAIVTTPVSPPPAEKTTPLGAIIGGAVGGFAVLAALGAGIFFCLRRRKSRATAQQHPHVGPGMVQYHPQPPPGSNEPGSPAPTYFAPGATSNKAYDAKYAQPAVYEQPPSGPSSPSPVYREQYSPPPMSAPAFNSAPPPPAESRYQAYQPPPPPLQVVPGGQVYYPPPVERNATSPGPAELGIRSPLPGTVNGRPLYEAA